jgi:hypothetical protein
MTEGTSHEVLIVIGCPGGIIIIGGSSKVFHDLNIVVLVRFVVGDELDYGRTSLARSV